jgi:hypothetical protein
MMTYNAYFKISSTTTTTPAIKTATNPRPRIPKALNSGALLTML